MCYNNLLRVSACKDSFPSTRLRIITLKISKCRSLEVIPVMFIWGGYPVGLDVSKLI